MSSDKGCCETHDPNQRAVEAVRLRCCSRETMSDLAAIFKLMGEPVRITILHALSIRDLCVCDLAELLGMSHSAVSHQLRLLRTARMVRFEKQGRKAIYSLNDRHVETIMQTALAHMQGDGCPPEKDI
ncbi:ArsR/SmtB family transcription factor [Maridesulfovibrio hydrothermalis]|uniref:Transcriptional repressor smtB n=1 Tax=Maridesulfovibrio hydrothermalis AM13 = DSM 14728 TaxID=1121451 RepID=L0REX0_9BACT|nr:metalloregulator ArsR/SmtB family transcription factor [Maridesulfovibrio hydrothermalis]CCO25328.1 Transcriptional repressor smtB [Maridesulfovibrio hydrothermalis AM13 = DSM 14728]